MVRFVLRSQESVARIRKHLAWLREALPKVAVVSVNLQPEHKAVLEGPEEIVLSRAEWLPMRLDDITFHLRPRSFFQTNSVVAAGLYQQAREWVHDVAPRSVLDLYCGVGGFALNAAVATGGPTRQVHGVEVAPDAVASARDAAAALRVDATFAVGDARVLQGVSADLVVVNPPRRGVGPDLCRALTAAAPEHVIYSSCNATSLATDLAGLPDHRVESARLFDMFPQTRHHEVIVLLRRR
jgi:23S rRNA (uracil747-C5)-methyltransferase